MRTLMLLIVCLLTGLRVFGFGKITGIIKDGQSNELLAGAVLNLSNADGTKNLAGTTSDLDGHFELQVKGGTYQLKVQYMGYEAWSEPITLQDQQVLQLEIDLVPSGKQSLDEVVIRGTLKKESVNALYTMQRQAVAVSSGISADLIQRSPDRNTGEVLKRVSGASVQDNKFVIVRGLNDRYNNALLNNSLMPATEPARKAFSFDMIPANIIDQLVISKTASPELPGEFAGGTVQVLTKDVPDENFFNFSTSIGYNTQATFRKFRSNGHGLLNNLGFDPPSRKLSDAFGQNYNAYKSYALSKQIEVSKTMPNNFGERTGIALPGQSYQLSWGNVRRMKAGGILAGIVALNYRRSETANTTERRRLISDYTWTYDYPEEHRYGFHVNTGAVANLAYKKGGSTFSLKNLYNRIYDDVYYRRAGYSMSNMQQQQLYSSVPMARALLHSQLDGTHTWGDVGSKFYWNLNFAHLGVQQNDLRTAFYSRSFTLDPNEGLPREQAQLPFQIVDRNSRRYFSTLNDYNYGANAHYATGFQWLGQQQTLKTGYYFLSRNRSFGSRIFNYQVADPTSFRPELQQLGPEKIFNSENIGADGFVWNEFTNPTDAYSVTGRLHAGFLMMDNKLSEKLRLVWGGRLEYYQQLLNTVSPSARPQEIQQQYADLLPSVNMSYALSTVSNLRLAASQTLSRPEFWEISPFAFFDFDNNWVMEGEPDLQRTKITNLDLRYELYPSAGESLVFSAFYKNFQRPIEAFLDPISGDADYISYFNSKSASSLGLELEFRKSLTFLGTSPFWERTTVWGNLAYIHSRVNVDGFAGGRDRPMMGQSPYLLNMAVQYQHPQGGWGATIMYNRIGQRIAYVGNGVRPNILENGRHLLDLQLSKSVLRKNATIKLSIADLLNSPYIFYQDMNFNNKAFEPGNASLAAASGDSVYRRYKQGTSITISFNYQLRWK